jgi:hypothetical protein
MVAARTIDHVKSRSSAERGQNRRRPEQLAGHRREVQHCRRSRPEAPVEWVEQGREAVPAHDRRKPHAANRQAHGIRPWGLHVQQSRGVRLLDGAVDVAAVHPGGGHREDADAEPEATSGQHEIAEAVGLDAACRPEAEGVGRKVERRHRRQAAPVRRATATGHGDGHDGKDERNSERRVAERLPVPTRRRRHRGHRNVSRPAVL